MAPYEYFPVILLAILVARIIASKYVRCFPLYIWSCMRKSCQRTRMLRDYKNFYQDRLLDSYRQNILVLNHGKKDGIPELKSEGLDYHYIRDYTFYTMCDNYQNEPHYCHVVNHTTLKDLFPERCFDYIIVRKHNKNIEGIIGMCRNLLKEKGYLYVETSSPCMVEEMGLLHLSADVKFNCVTLPFQVSYTEYIRDTALDALKTLFKGDKGDVKLHKFMKRQYECQAPTSMVYVTSKEIIEPLPMKVKEKEKDKVKEIVKDKEREKVKETVKDKEKVKDKETEKDKVKETVKEKDKEPVKDKNKSELAKMGAESVSVLEPVRSKDEPVQSKVSASKVSTPVKAKSPTKVSPSSVSSVVSNGSDVISISPETSALIKGILEGGTVNIGTLMNSVGASSSLSGEVNSTPSTTSEDSEDYESAT
jgi:hypothetical protein